MPTTPSTPTRKKTVLIVDDHPLLREGLRGILNQQADLRVCGEAGDAPEALAAVEKFQPDVVLLDISLPGCDGLDLAKELHDRHPKLPVLMLSQHDEAAYAERALRIPTRGYILKQASPDHITRAIRQVLAGADRR